MEYFAFRVAREFGYLDPDDMRKSISGILWVKWIAFYLVEQEHQEEANAEMRRQFGK